MVLKRVPPTEMFGKQNEESERRDRGLLDALRIDGAQFVRLYEKMQALIAGLNDTVTTLVAAALAGVISPAGVTTGGSVSASGNIGAGGEVSGNHATFPGGVNSVDVYNRLLTYGGGYKNQYIHADGNMGYVPSLREFKQDVEEWVFDPAILSYLRVVTFRYIAAVERLGDKAEQELGLIAEELLDLGYCWLIDYEVRYTEAGAQAPVPYQGEVVSRPIGVKYERLSLIIVSWAQSIEERLAAAGI
ncbi:hypothetical protein ACFWWU_36545 [Streptomyces sp. NPDC058650]|uniref:hypothetical protein n=1 Tax=Streptomyces sp. NPDC058650 TaxID=3346575 RepID=UPI0036499527